MCRFLVLVINLPMLIINIPNEKRVLLEYTNPARLFSHLVLCQDLVQHKMRNFNYFQLTNRDSLATLAL